MWTAFDYLLHFWYDFFIEESFVIVTIFLLCKVIFQGRIDTEVAQNILKWLIVLFTATSILNLSWRAAEAYYDQIGYESYDFRITGPYWWAYAFMIFANTIVPLFLIHKKLGKNIYFLLTVSILMNIGWLFERAVIWITSLHRDYVPPDFAEKYNTIYKPIIMFLTNGLIVAIILLALGNFISKMNARRKLT